MNAVIGSLHEKMVDDYQVGKRIATVSGASLHHARLKNGERVVLKQPQPNTLTPAQLSRFPREYELLSSLAVDGIVKPRALAGEPTRPVIVLDYFDGESLETFLERTRLDVKTGLRLGRELANTLAHLHAAGIMHRDVRPANLWLTPQGHHLMLLDLSLASDMQGAASREDEALGDWAYRSPEQTGRMNRPVDYRTDIYSLGITLYRMLTGQLPFTAEDPLEWVHCHVARLPPAPQELVPAIPQIVSDIVMKLLAKLPEDRYQSMHGVRADLERCLAQWEADSGISPFALGSEDFSGQFYIPRKLYGREQEVASLHEAFTQMAETGQPRLVMVGGYTGIGKSALVNELQQPIVREHGYFISGKFDQYLHDIPYATLRQAFQDLMRQLFSESEARIAQWRQEILAAVGTHGQLVVDILPQVEVLIGKQPPVPELPPMEAQHRFRRVFRQFVAVFAQASHPLVLFLDDLQWIDVASLQFIESLLTHADTRYLLLIGAYRDNEVNAGHLLLSSIETMRRAHVPVQEIALTPLPLDALNRLVADTLHAKTTLCEPLTELIFDKTEGNPFFFIQFLMGLYKEGLLRYDTEARAWHWTLAQIRDRNFADNVVDLMLAKLRRLPTPTQEALQVAACLGNKFTLEHLAIVNEKDAAEVEQHLSPAFAEGLVMLADGNGRFLHDRIQQVAYSLIAPEHRSAIHLQIGRALLANLNAEALAQQLFDVANQFNLGVGMLTDPQEKAQVAALNLRAGRKAKASAAYASARVYLAAGMDLLEESDWEHRYELMFGLWLERANCEFLVGHFDEAMRLIEVLLQRGASTIDLATVYRLKILLHVVKSENPQAVESGIACLRLFGIDLPAHPTGSQVQAEYDIMWRNLGDRPIESLIELPLMTNPDMQAVTNVLSDLINPGVFTDMNFTRVLYCRIVNLSLKHGIASATSYGYVVLGTLTGPDFHRYHDGYRFVRLAVDLVEKHGFIAEQARTYFVMGIVAAWTQPIGTALEYGQKAFRTGVETGDLANACCGCIVLTAHALFHGDTLEDVWRASEEGLAFCRKSRFRDVADIIVSHQQFIKAMQGRTVALSTFNDAQFDEAAFEAQLTPERMQPMCYWYWCMKLQVRFMAGDYAGTLTAAEQAKAVFWSSAGQVQTLYYHYYTALAITAVYQSSEGDTQRAWREQLAGHQEQLREWAENCYSPTFRDKYMLVAAEIARLDGRDLDALHLYQQAITSAHDNGFAQNEGIAHELAARFYLTRGFSTEGNAHLAEARHCFVRWGADGKVAQLDARYPSLRSPPAASSAISMEHGDAQLDLLSVAKASQAISGRILLDELVDTLMRIVLENAGAQRGSLLLARNEAWIQVADVRVDQQTLRVQLHLDAPAASLLPLPISILNYVRRSREKVLLADASQPHVLFSPNDADDYFVHHHPKSVLCLPILRQDALIGMLYLENSLITDAFTPERLAVLELLASQAAISLENALLYTDLQQENSERKRAELALRKAHDELEMRVQARTAELNESNQQLQGEILERQQVEANLARSNAELEQLAYVASHDLQEPLRMVASYLQLLEQRYEGSLDADAHEFIDFAVNGAKRMQALINDLLTYSRIGTKSMPLRSVDCAVVMESVLHSLSMAIAESDAQITCNKLPVVMADATQLAQLFQNLLSNAIKFRREKPVRIHVAVEPDGDFWRFSVQDNGIGIAPEYFERIFVMFQRLNSRRRYEGTGMGLAICKKIVERHGGHLWVESVPGQGSTFYFTLLHARENAQGGD